VYQYTSSFSFACCFRGVTEECQHGVLIAWKFRFKCFFECLHHWNEQPPCVGKVVLPTQRVCPVGKTEGCALAMISFEQISSVSTVPWQPGAPRRFGERLDEENKRRAGFRSPSLAPPWRNMLAAWGARDVNNYLTTNSPHRAELTLHSSLPSMMPSLLLSWPRSVNPRLW
jgi:hypothetical protein